MAEIIKAIKGTCDVTPDDSYKWQYVEQTMLNTASLYGYREIRIPVFEYTEVFSRGVGDTTDVVQKEMYTFQDKGGRSITLRPEFTAGVVRSAIENGLVSGTLPVKACYLGGCYRYEKPQAGRLREFHQFGIECIGANTPAADAEVILLANQVLSDIGIKNLSLEINSIGCPTCRAEYHKALKAYFADNSDELCGTCKDRLERNPMRILDCKSPVCKGIAEGAPVVLDFLCDECKEHHAQLQAHLDAAGLKYTVNPQIVRGLDYYTKTVFEFVSGDIGAQSTVCGGGRYDGLIAQLGGPAVQSVGFAMGLERLMMVLTAQNAEFPPVASCDIYFVPMNSDAQIYATKLCSDLRNEGFEALSDINGRGMRAQLKYANKIGAKFTCVLGDDEINGDTLRIKNMASGEETEVNKNNLVDEFYSLINTLALDNLTDSVF
ncbi:MAG: histidine--tRNA ligase [Ruminococcaceae bacterium]|nr:histidine--tRNA ligase [Oscillospiraceae bacterium]